MQGAEERRLRRMSNTPQGGAIEGNAADDALMVDQGKYSVFHSKVGCAIGHERAAPTYLRGGFEWAVTTGIRSSRHESMT